MRLILFFAAAAVANAGCHRSPPPQAASNAAAERTVFTDSAFHSEKCEPVKPGENWRTVCTPKDQGVRIPQRKSP
jgi:hypothetical protein